MATYNGPLKIDQTSDTAGSGIATEDTLFLLGQLVRQQQCFNGEIGRQARPRHARLAAQFPERGHDDHAAAAAGGSAAGLAFGYRNVLSAFAPNAQLHAMAQPVRVCPTA
jgi:hypothetical protein